MTLSRDGCCADWPKPCSYHEGVQDALDYWEQDEGSSHNLNGWGMRSGYSWSSASRLSVSSSRWRTVVAFQAPGPLGVVTPAGIHTWTLVMEREDSGEQGAWVYMDGDPFADIPSPGVQQGGT